jgi:hypothetical protein
MEVIALALANAGLDGKSEADLRGPLAVVA